MKSLNSLFLVPVLVFASWVFLCDLSAHANQLTYSWEGRLGLSEADDPWQIGPDGEAFELYISVSRNAEDLQPEPDVQFAVFQVEEVRLVLNGDDIIYVDEGVLDFTDGHINWYDFLFFGGNFERLGSTPIEIASAVAVPHDTFEFTSLIALPPYFSSTAVADRTTTVSDSPYFSVVEENTPVLVVPEPTAMAFLMAGGLMLMHRRAQSEAWVERHAG